MSFFQTVSADRSTEKILAVSSFSICTVQLNHHVKYIKNIRVHDIRAEVLIKVNDKNN